MTTKTITQIDINATKLQLKYLGWKNPSEATYTRCLKNSTAKEYSHVDFNTLDTQNQAGYGVYLIVNSRNATKPKKKMIGDENITECHAIFCEWDYKENSPNSNEQYTLDQQLIRWRDVNFVQPTFVVFSGNKSMQAYWVFNETITPDVWKDLQVKLITVMDGDRAIKNPSRLMRLAGYRHQKTGQLSTIAEDSGLKYDAQDLSDRLKAILDKPAPLPTEPIKINIPAPNPITASAIPVPLDICLAKINRERLMGVNTSRNIQMHTLALDLLGVEQYFRENSIYTSDNAENLFLTACQRCGGDTSFNSDEWKRIWASALKDNPRPTLSIDKLENCINAYINKQVKAIEKDINKQVKAIEKENTKARPILSKDETTTSPKTTKDESRNFDPATYTGRKTNRYLDHEAIKAKLGDRLRLNLLTHDIELDGVPLDLDTVEVSLPDDYGIMIFGSKESTITSLKYNAAKNQYHPIKEYLTQNFEKIKPENTDLLDNLASKYFGLTDPLYNLMVKKTIIGAVARIFNPGCKFDTALILQGPGGLKKSSFFRTLASDDWFDDGMSSMGVKDEALRVHQSWILELSELERVYNEKQESLVKQFMTITTDNIRPPYERAARKFARQSIFVGTTNKTSIFQDNEGERRFWIIPVKDHIDINSLEKDRNKIWAQACLAYQNGESWWLDQDNELAVKNLASNYTDDEPWLDPIARFLENKDLVSMAEIMIGALDIPKERHRENKSVRKIATILRELGWDKVVTNSESSRRKWARVKNTKSDHPTPPPVIVSEPLPDKDDPLIAPFPKLFQTNQTTNTPSPLQGEENIMSPPENNTNLFSPNERIIIENTDLKPIPYNNDPFFQGEDSNKRVESIPDKKNPNDPYSDPYSEITKVDNDPNTAPALNPVVDQHSDRPEKTDLDSQEALEILDKLKNSVTIGDLQEVRRTYPRERMNEVARSIECQEKKILGTTKKILQGKINICKQIWDGKTPTDIFKDVNAVGVNETLEALKIYLDNQTPIESAIAPFKVIEDNWALLTAKAWVICNKAYERYDTLAPGVLLATIYQDDEGS